MASPSSSPQATSSKRLPAPTAPTRPVLRGWRKKLFGDDALALKRGELALVIKKGEVVVIAPRARPPMGSGERAGRRRLESRSR